MISKIKIRIKKINKMNLDLKVWVDNVLPTIQIDKEVDLVKDNRLMQLDTQNKINNNIK